MEQLAPPGTIRLTAETLRLAEGWVQVTPLGSVPVRGLLAPVEVCELVGAGPARTRLQTFAARGLTPFVGRQAELAALHQALEQARAGHGQVVAVIGEPGVGKTRLFHEFTHASRTQGWLLLESSSTSYGKATPYLPVIDLLKALPLLERAIGLCRDADFPGYVPRITPALGAAYTLAGRVADAVPLLTQAMEQAMTLEMGVYQTLCCLPLGEAHLAAGHLEEAQVLAEQALTLARAHQEGIISIYSHV